MAQRDRLAERHRHAGLDWGLAVILLLAGALALRLAFTQSYVHDENNTSIPLARTISFDFEQLRLPLRGENHGAMPAYVVKASSSLFGTSMPGYRCLHVILGLATVALVFRMAQHAFGIPAARWAALLLAFNEYYLGVSFRATAHVPHLFFVALALFAFSRFLSVQRAGYLYGAAAALGAAFYCKESAALLLPVFALVAVFSARHRRWLWNPHVYLACLTFVLVIGADLVWNSRTWAAPAHASYGGQVVRQATYRTHLDRVGGLGFSPYPLMFYAHDAVQAGVVRITGRALADETPEYRSMNTVLGVMLLCGVVMTAARVGRFDSVTLLFLATFWSVFLFFSIIRPGSTTGRLDAVSWIWVESTLLPAAVLAGVRLAELKGAVRWPAAGITVAALAWASADALGGVWSSGTWAAEEGRAAVHHSWQVLAQDLVVLVRARPLVALGVALLAGALSGLVIGVSLGRASNKGRS